MRYRFSGDAAVEFGGRIISPGEEIELRASPGRSDFERVTEDAEQPADRPPRKGRDKK